MPKPSEGLILGLECGGTRTIAILSNARRALLERKEFGPANLKILSDLELREHLEQIARAFPVPVAIGIGMAGARTPTDWERVRKSAAQVWQGAPVEVTNDLEIALLAAENENRRPQVLVLSGTGSCCYGAAGQGRKARMGGWGHILGDKGSGYEIGLRGLKASVYYFDRDGRWGKLGQNILRELLLNEPNELVDWAQRADKRSIAALAPVVFASAKRGDKTASDILEGAANSLARDAVACARKLLKKPGPVTFILAGSVLLRQAQFAGQVGSLIRKAWSGAEVVPLQKEAAWGAVELVAGAIGKQASGRSKQPKMARAMFVPPLALEASPTEKRNPRSKDLDQLSAAEGVRLMLNEEKRVIPALLREEKDLARASEIISRAMKAGGRLFYTGAGTSGRLGVLDASECPPTFRADPDQVQGIIAGGERALRHAVEGAEDNAEAGARAVRFRGVTRKDVVVGIAASGRTPFIWGALAAARKLGARTILLSFNPSLDIPKAHRPDVMIAADLGPEVLTGSTRLKAGTATKLVLNIFSTLGMVRQGKVISNLMIDLNPSNTKLRDRAVRIIQELTGADAETARDALVRQAWVVKEAFRELAGRSGAGRATSSPSARRAKRNGRGRSAR